MSKYIIELKDDIQVVQKVGVTENGNAFVMNFYKDQLEELKLNSDYINKHFSDLQDTAYQRGLNDAWECARKLFSSMADSDIEKAFPTEWNNGGFKALMNLQPQEAIAKLKVYEEKQKHDDKIEVGDTVNLKDGSRDNDGIVTKSWDNDRHFIMWADGSGGVWDKEYIVKTGRHFDIASILKEMQS